MPADPSLSRALSQAVRDSVRAYLEAHPAVDPAQIDLSKCPPTVVVDGIPPLPGESALAYCRRVEAMPRGG